MEIDHQDKVDAMSLVLENFDSVLERLCVKYKRTPINPKKKQELEMSRNVQSEDTQNLKC